MTINPVRTGGLLINGARNVVVVFPFFVVRRTCNARRRGARVDAEPVPIPATVRGAIVAGLVYVGVFALAHFVRSEAARDHGVDSARQIRRSSAEAPSSAWRAHRPRAKHDPTRPDRALSRHAGGRARRRRQHARRLSARPRRLLRRSRRAGARIATATTDDICAPISPSSPSAACSRLGGAAALGHPPALSFPLRGRPPRRRSGRRARGAEARRVRCRRC